MCLLSSMKIQWILYGMCICTNVLSGETLIINMVVKEICARSLTNVISYLCTDSFSDGDSSGIQYKGNRATFLSERYMRNYIDECCLRPCSISQLMEYCPQRWWRQDYEQFLFVVLYVQCNCPGINSDNTIYYSVEDLQIFC